MNKSIHILIILAFLITFFSGCSEVERPDVLKINEISKSETEVVNNSKNNINSIKEESDLKETEEVIEVKDELYKDGYYGVPVKINDTYYKLPALKLLNYYFVELESVSNIYNFEYTVKDDTLTILSPTKNELDLSFLESGKLKIEEIDTKKTKLLNDENSLALSYLDKNYISLTSLSNILPEGSKLYIDRELGIITDKKPDIVETSDTNNGLLRKSISIDSEHQLVVKDGTYGNMLVVYDIYGSSLDITPDDISFSKNLQNILLHKVNGKIYMFGLMGNSVEVYEINVSKDYVISIVSNGFIQRQVQNIYYINGQYIALGRQEIFGINIGKGGINEINFKSIPDIKETAGIFNMIDNVYYLTIRNNLDKLCIYKLDIDNLSLTLEKEFALDFSFEGVKNNFMYSFIENGEISIYAMDSLGYIYNIRYNKIDDTTLFEQTETFKLFYAEGDYQVELSIDLVKSGEPGQSELNLIVNGKHLGNNILVFGVEDNWVYCSEYSKNGDEALIYPFRYHAITGVKDYSNSY